MWKIIMQTQEEKWSNHNDLNNKEDGYGKQHHLLRPQDAPARICHGITAARKFLFDDDGYTSLGNKGGRIFLPIHHRHEQQFWSNDSNNNRI